MFFSNERSPKRVVEIIESLHSSLLFSSEEKLAQMMKSINFNLDKKEGWIIIYSGNIHNQIVELTFMHIGDSSNVRLIYKFYRILDKSLENVIFHRENDLPTIIEYFSDSGEIKTMKYCLHNVEQRFNNKPVFITINENKRNEKFLRYQKLDDYSADNFSIYSVDLINERWNDVTFCYNNKPLLLDELIEIIPSIKELNLIQLKTLNTDPIITSELVSLLDMKRI